MASTWVLTLDGLQAVIDLLLGQGYTVLGPTVADGVIDYRAITGVEDLPKGWGDEQEAASYRLRRRDDDAVFAYAAGAQSAKPVFFPADELLWRSRLTDREPDVEQPDAAAAGPRGTAPYAFLGMRSCDLAAVTIHDTILAGRAAVDTHYAGRRADSVVIAVTCTDPAGTCFCTSMGTGPVPRQGFDLALTELYADGPHRFIAEPGTPKGEELLEAARGAEATEDDLASALRVGEEAAGRMGRHLDSEGIRNLLYDSAESAVWDEIASRCLSCTNCTLVCPTCFCTSVDDVSDLAGTTGERHRVWDSCFSQDYSYIHGGAVRVSGAARYRQWMTHKLGSWVDQFGMSGCVGCGRCIAWCPAGIDITAEAAVLRRNAEQRDERRARS
jgi:ferredoxin